MKNQINQSKSQVDESTKQTFVAEDTENNPQTIDPQTTKDEEINEESTEDKIDEENKSQPDQELISESKDIDISNSILDELE